MQMPKNSLLWPFAMERAECWNIGQKVALKTKLVKYSFKNAYRH
jgi:hypothetical protein